MSDATTDAGSGRVRRTHRWRGVLAVTLVAGAVGLAAQRQRLLLLAAVGVVYAAYPRTTRTPHPAVDLDREVRTRTPGANEDVTVTVTVRNASDRTLADVRVVDGVPPALTVTDGIPRHGTALRAGESDSFSYAVRAVEGRHTFDAATVAVRDVSGGTEREFAVAAETELDCTTELPELPLGDRTIDAVGRIRSRTAGTGTEFSRTREYRRGDAMSRVDWNRYARTGDLTTVEYREERAGTVLLAVDARRVAYRSAPGEPHAVSRAVDAADRLLVALLRDRNRVGVAGLAPEACWIPPGTGRDHRIRARQALATHPAFASRRPDAAVDLEAQSRRLRGRLAGDAQIVLLSPLCDDDVVATVRRFVAHGHAVSVVSPDATGSETSGQRLAAVERSNRVRRLRRAGVRVVEWPSDRPLAAAVARAMEAPA
ncbi:MAG: DUF58 domain-containing protein [Haloarculaceae archaeon]